MKKTAIIVTIVLIAIQFYRPDKNSSHTIRRDKDFLVAERVPSHIATIIKNACYDCHSDRTEYACFDNIAPISWYVDSTIQRAKRSLNFSHWSDLEPWQRRLFIQGAIVYDIKTKRMPPKGYRILHPKAEISKDQMRSIEVWLSAVDLTKE